VTVGAFIAQFGIPLLLAAVAAGAVAFLLLRDLGRRDTDAKAKARTDLILGKPGEHRNRFGLRRASAEAGAESDEPREHEEKR